jgi:putative membrane protein
MQTDPRVFFASERTLLAWVRTGIAIVGLGFVVSRFGLFLRVIAGQLNTNHGGAGASGSSSVLGILLVLLGAVSIAGASLQHARFVASIPEQDRPTHYSRNWALWLSGMVTLASILLAAHLALAAWGAS